MRWEDWVLNDTNRGLQRRIDQIADDVEKKSSDVASERAFVILLRKNLAQVKSHIILREKAVAEEQERLLRDEEELRTLQCEAARYRADLQQLRRRHEEVRDMLQCTNSAVQTKAGALEQERNLSAALEQAALEIFAAHTLASGVQETEREVERRRRSLEAVHASLPKAHAALCLSRSALQREMDEFAVVQRDLKALRLGATRGKRDKAESWMAVARLQEAVAKYDEQIAANMEACASEKQVVETQRNLLKQLEERHKGFLTDLRGASSKLENRKRDKEALLARLQVLSDKTERQEDGVAALRRQLAAQRDVKRQMTLSRSNALDLRDGRHAHLQQQLLRLGELRELVEETRASSDGHLSACLESTRVLLLQRLLRLEAHIERVGAATMASLSALHTEGKISEELNHQLTKKREALVAADRDYATYRQSREVCQRHLDDLVERVAEVKRDLEKARDVVREKSQQEHAFMEGVVWEMQVQLNRMRERGFFLRREITPLQCTLNAHAKLMDDAKEKLALLTKENALQKVELQGVEADSARLTRKKNAAILHNSQAMLRLQSVSRVAESNMELMRGAASIGDILRGQALVMQEKISADMNNALLELHLEQKLCAEKHAELRRRQEHLQLLRSRYEGIMESMGRRLTAGTGADVAGGELHPVVTGLSPENIHAQSILQLSSIREKLRERGNYLDTRIVFLENETRNLRKMMGAIRAGGGAWRKDVGQTQPPAPQETNVDHLLLCHGEGKQCCLVRGELKREAEELQKQRARLCELKQRRKDIVKELCELRSLKNSRESTLRRLKVQLKRERLKQKQ